MNTDLLTAPRPAWKTYAPAWLGAAGLGVANGIARGALYERRAGERTAHQISTVTLIAMLAAYLRVLERRQPIASDRDALAIGAGWAAATVAFEFGFGRGIAHESWTALLRDYDVRRGRLWPLVLLWMAFGPLVMRQELARCPAQRSGR